MDFGNVDKLNRRALLRGTAMLGAGAMMMRPLPTLAASGPMAAIRKAAEAGKEASVKRLRDWIALPSIAAENRNMAEGAAYMAELARDAGFSNVEIVPTDGQPGVFGTIDVGAPRTLGIYFMYDVKQFDPAEWSSPPLEGKMVDKPGFGLSIVGRGAVNQKGPEATFLAALHAIRAAKAKLPVNIVLICEGEEEIGSPHFRQVATKPNVLAALKKCDGIFIPFASQDKTGAVDVNLGSKGIIELELIASGEKWGRGPKGDVHSSLKAMLDSPAWRLVQALQTLVTPDGNTPAIEGWFENVRPLTEREKMLIREAAKGADEAAEKQALGVNVWIDNLKYDDALIRLAQEPTVNIEGLVAGYTGPGGKTILPGRAVAKLDLRLVPNQTRAEAEKKLRAHLDKHGFTDVEMNVSGGYDPTEVAEDSRLVRTELATYKALGVKANINARLAGSWPGATFTAPPVSIPAAHFGIGHGSGAHAPNEYYLIDSTNPKVAGMVDATMGFAEFLYTLAAIKWTGDLNGVAHVILTAGDFARSTAFWRDLIAYLELKVVLDSDAMLYGVGGRTAIGIRTGSPENAGKRFDQGAPGLHHACFRMRDRDAVDRLYALLKDRSDIVFVHGPQEEPWAPGYYSILFEDPDGIRIEFNHVPGVGLLEAGREIGGAEIFD